MKALFFLALFLMPFQLTAEDYIKCMLPVEADQATKEKWAKSVGDAIGDEALTADKILAVCTDGTNKYWVVSVNVSAVAKGKTSLEYANAADEAGIEEALVFFCVKNELPGFKGSEKDEP